MKRFERRKSSARRFLLISLAGFGAVLAANGLAAAESSCALQETASLPASFSDGTVAVDVSVNGTKVKFRLGTSSVMSQISSALVRRLSLAVHSLAGNLIDDRGAFRPDATVISEFKLGEMVASSKTFIVTAEGGDGTTDEPAGVVAADFTSNYDLEIDPSRGRVNIFKPIKCPAKAVYWNPDHFELPISQTEKRSETRVTIDGKEFFAYIATEAERSSIDIVAAKDKLGVPSGVTAPVPSFAPPAPGGDQSDPRPLYTFSELGFGPVTIKHPKFALQRYQTLSSYTGSHIKTSAATEVPVVIGMDFLGKFHSMISPGNGRIFFTLPNERSADSGVTAKQ